MEKSADVVDLISNLLSSGKYKEALSVPNDKKHSDRVKDNCSDVISTVIEKIDDQTALTKPSLQNTCEELLLMLIEKTSPEEALLEFIEQIEVAKNDGQFCIILHPLQQLLKKLSIKRGRSLEWCLNAISTYIEEIPTPDYQLEGKERLLMDSDPNMRRVIKVYSQIPAFYNPFLKEITVDGSIKSKQILAAFLITLLGKPLLFIDLDPKENEKSEARQCCSTILQDICMIEKDICKILVHLDICHNEDEKKSRKNNDQDEIQPYQQREKINMTTLSGLFYGVFSKHFTVPDTAIPQVYSTEYIVHTAMLSVVHLLCMPEFGPISKGLALGEALTNRLADQAPHTLLASSIHFDLLKTLVGIAIYSTYETLRKRAVNLIGAHVNKFDYKGRCKLVRYLIETSNHSGMIGYTITLFKNMINEVFMSTGEFPDCLKGAQLLFMVKKICHLPHGLESDLVELADQIITSLNFLRYMTLKDTENKTGISECLPYIENEYLDKLRIGLNMSKAHYELKLKDIEEGKDLPEEKVDVSINIAGNFLDKIPLENKKQIILSALNAFHLIEGLVGRLSECINLNKMRTLSVESLRNGRRFVPRLAPVTTHARAIRCYSSNADINAENDTRIVSPITEKEEHQYEEDVKTRILENALQFVPKSGWSVESLSAGAEAAGYPGITHGLFPNGGGDLVHFFNVKCNEELVAQMKEWPKEDLKEMKVPAKFVEDAIVTRLLMIEPYKSTWPKAMAIQALPNNVPNCLATLLSLVDDICYHSGDRSVDINWYIRRVGLAGIYKAAELFYLTDNTGGTATRNFVNSRIRDARLIQAALNMNPVSAAPQTLTAAFVTAKNILGINTLK